MYKILRDYRQIKIGETIMITGLLPKNNFLQRKSFE